MESYLNLLIVDSLATPAAADAAFLSWTGLAAIGAILIFAGAFIDWLLRRKHKDTILLHMAEFEYKLARLPVREWQVRIAGAVIRFWERLEVVSSDGINMVLNRTADLLYDILGVFWSIAAVTAVLALPFTVLLLANLTTLLPHFPWSITIMLTCLAAYSCYGLFVLVLTPIEMLRDHTGSRKARNALKSAFDWVEGSFTEPFYDRFAPVFFVSVLFTGCAIGIGLLMGTGATESYWFALENGNLAPARPITMSLLNFPFDFITILVSIRLLKFVKEKGRHIVSIALFDIVISGVLVIVLHATLKIFEPGGWGHIGQNFTDSWHWFVQVVTFKASPNHPDWLLTPTLFTTFIPVTLYMAAFIFLGIIIKPFAKVAGYICGLLFEKEQTPFLAFSLILSGLLLVCKALSEWQWFVHLFQGWLS